VLASADAREYHWSVLKSFCISTALHGRLRIFQKFQSVEKHIGSRMMCLGSDKFIISKLDNMKLRKITRITRNNLNSRI
jgi:hypothetical protein